MTQVVHVPLGDRAYDIQIGRGLLDQAGSLIGLFCSGPKWLLSQTATSPHCICAG